MVGSGSGIDLRSLLRKPSAFIPLLSSLAAMGIIVVHIALEGTAPQPDEGTAAHLWQLVMVAQLPIIAFFALAWMPVAPKEAMRVLVLQVAALVLAVAPVLLLHW